MSIEKPENLCLQPFATLPGGEKVYAFLTAKYAEALGLSLQAAEAPTLFNGIAQVYREHIQEKKTPPLPEKCLVAGIWRALIGNQIAVDFNHVHTSKPPVIPEEPRTRTHTRENPILPMGTAYTLTQSHGIYKNGKTEIPVSYFAVQQEGFAAVRFRVYPTGSNGRECLDKDFIPYEEETVTVMHPDEKKRREHAFVRRMLAAPLDDTILPPDARN